MHIYVSPLAFDAFADAICPSLKPIHLVCFFSAFADMILFNITVVMESVQIFIVHHLLRLVPRVMLLGRMILKLLM